MRMLLIDDEARALVARLRAFAERPENWYYPGRPGAQAPGDSPEYCITLNTYRCVFTLTKSKDGSLYRHLSISVPSQKYPNPAAAFMIADLFGFTGWDQRTLTRLPEGWMAKISAQEHCIILVQPIGGEHAAA